MFSAKQGHYWYHFYNVFGMTRSLTGLNPGPPALEASTIPLGYRGGGTRVVIGLMIKQMYNMYFFYTCKTKYHMSAAEVQWKQANGQPLSSMR